MSAQNLSKQQFQLFHGTNVEFNEGDIITPPKSGPRSLVFATEDIDYAKGRARYAASGVSNVVHRDKDKAKYSKKGIVYKVEPIKDYRPDPLAGGKAGGVWISKTGFKVIGKV